MSHPLVTSFVMSIEHERVDSNDTLASLWQQFCNPGGWNGAKA